jgi:hypothetical protein
MVAKVSKVNTNFNILVGILYCGEHEFNDCINALNRQIYKNWKHVTFRFLANKIAHDTLYRFFMDNAKNFDLMIKLDADMVFSKVNALNILVDLFSQNPTLDHAEIALHDWYSDSIIMGLHAFSNRVRWKVGKEDLFVDGNPTIPGKKIFLWNDPAPLASHCPNPSPFQAFHFGVHRASKLVQNGKDSINWYQALFQYNLLKKVWNHFLKTTDRRLGFVLIGADLVFKTKLMTLNYDYSNPELLSIFKRYQNLKSPAMMTMLYSGWNDLNFMKVLGIKKFLLEPLKFITSLHQSRKNHHGLRM